jgi:hypothetical protein
VQELKKLQRHGMSIQAISDLTGLGPQDDSQVYEGGGGAGVWPTCSAARLVAVRRFETPACPNAPVHLRLLGDPISPSLPLLPHFPKQCDRTPPVSGVDCWRKHRP